MEIPNYDSNGNKNNNYKQLYQYMPHDTFLEGQDLENLTCCIIF